MEKAGIMKENVPVIIGETTPETRPVFEAVAKETGAHVVFAEDDPEVLKTEITNSSIHYLTKHYGNIQGELKGIYQEKNANTILTAVRKLEELGYMYRFNDNSRPEDKGKEVANGFLSVCEITGLKGRWQTISEHPKTVCDTGHNVAGWEYISRQLSMVRCNKMHIVFGIVEDKDLDGIMNLLPKDATYYFTKAANKRSVSENVLKIIGEQKGLIGESYPSVIEACQSAQKAAAPDDFVFIGGSSYVVADFLQKRIFSTLEPSMNLLDVVRHRNINGTVFYIYFISNYFPWCLCFCRSRGDGICKVDFKICISKCPFIDTNSMILQVNTMTFYR
jgi:dihydrofolate synthase/folylpolyglutamate synthase